MIGTSFIEWIVIQLSIPLFRYTPFIYLIALFALFLAHGKNVITFIPAQIIFALFFAEALFFIGIYLPYQTRLSHDARHPVPLSPKERRALFDRCLIHVKSPERYLQWWFLGADLQDIKRENLKEFLLWAFFERSPDPSTWTDCPDVEAIFQELDGLIAEVERRLGKRLEYGRGNAKSLRLTLDDIHTTYRSLGWYTIIFFIDQITHLTLLLHRFEYYKKTSASAMRVFPPRPQQFLPCQRSPASELSYWYRPHTARDRLPVVFFHGIGIGLWTYVQFLADLNARSWNGQGDIGIIALEIMPISFRLTPPVLDKATFLNQMTRILDHHHWDNFAVTSHSYGSVLTAHLLHSPRLQRRISSVVLIDPVTLMLHLPDVAYNFTRRKPRLANEWQLWYFASTDLGVAYCLGRHFFWRENILWKEELLEMNVDGQTRERKAAVCLSGRDLIVDTAAVAQYLEDDVEEEASDRRSSFEVVMFPKLDHAQVFDGPERQRVVDIVRAKCQY